MSAGTFTTVYEREESDPQISRRFAAVEGNGGRVCLVRLICSRDVLERRVVAPHRTEMNKIASVEGLRRSIAEQDLFAAIPGRDSLVVDTTHIDPVQTATRIIDHYGLRERTIVARATCAGWMAP